MNEEDTNEDDMSELEELSKDLSDIKFTKRIHPGLVSDSKTNNLGIRTPEELYDWMKKEFGHCIMGKWQFLYERDGETISCVRGGVSFGNYEIYGAGMDDPERFATGSKTLARIKELLKVGK